MNERDERLLIFPGGMEASLNTLKMLGTSQVVGASSIYQDPAQSHYQYWETLPFIQEKSFNDAFFNLVKTYQVTQVFSPHKVIWKYFENLLADGDLNLKLLGSDPLSLIFDKHRDLMDRASILLEQSIHLICSYRPLLTRLAMSTILKHAYQIEGESDDTKIALLCEIARSIPESGDIVEIGSAWGRSAFVLLQLANHYRLGSLLCIDPWSSDEALQSDSENIFNLTLRHMTRSVDFNEIFEAFIINLWPYNNQKINYIRRTSREAFQIYCQPQVDIQSKEFHSTVYQRQIACLHIDGNHDYAVVKEDIETWSSLLMPGGWLLIDDYIWTCGVGPQRAGDEYLVQFKEEISCAFVAGTTLCIKKSCKNE